MRVEEVATELDVSEFQQCLYLRTRAITLGM